VPVPDVWLLGREELLELVLSPVVGFRVVVLAFGVV
jgi:hypothetical protein